MFCTTISKFTKEDTSTLYKFYLSTYTQNGISAILHSVHCNNNINDNNGHNKSFVCFSVFLNLMLLFLGGGYLFIPEKNTCQYIYNLGLAL